MGGKRQGDLRRRMPRTLARTATAIALAGGAFAGCGESEQNVEPSEAVELRIDRERKEAATLARQQKNVEDLRAEVRRLKSGKGATASATPAPSPPQASSSPSASGASRAFHAPSANVNCEITETTARCSVVSIGQSFVMPSGGAARMESGIAVSEGAGALADWGESVSLGQITCVIPLESQPRGITCENLSTGHGFEASRVPERQRTY